MPTDRALHKEILSPEQTRLLPLLGSFSKDFGLVGGTAIALYLGHRRSIDFDLFTNKEFENLKIRRKILNFKKIKKVLKDETGQYTVIVNNVGLTFFYYPFRINFLKKLDNLIKIPDLPTLAAMKAYALGHRPNWKDYVDLYFIMKKYVGIKKIIKKAKDIFAQEFNEKLFRSQLSFFKDIDYTKKIIYMQGLEVKDEIIKKELVNFSIM